MRKSLKISTIAISVILLMSCAKKAEDSASQDASVTAEAPASARSEASQGGTSAEVTQVSTAQQLTSNITTYNDAERKFIRTATLSFGVKDVYQSALAIEDVVAAQGGFVSRNDIKSTPQNRTSFSNGDKIVDVIEYAIEGELIVRIPSQKTQDFLRAIVSQIEFLESRTFEAKDAQFEMLRQQLEAMRQQIAQAQLEQLSQQKGNISQKTEVINSSTQSKAARDEALIQQKEFEDQVAFATITINIQQPYKIRKTESNDLSKVVAENRPNFFKRVAESFVVGWYWAIDSIVLLARAWALWLIIGVALILRRWFKGRRLEKQSKKKCR